MIHIEESIIIPIEGRGVYDLLKRINLFPKFMKDIKRIECRKLGHNSIISNWDITIDGATIKWREQDIYNDVSKTIIFKMLEGDYNRYEGTWKVVDLAKGAKLVFAADIDWGAPAFVKFVEPILTKKTKRSIRSMLLAIKKKLAK